MTKVAWVPWESAEEIGRVVGEVPEGVTLLPFTDGSQLPGPVEEVGFLTVPYMQGPACLERAGQMPRLEVVQAQSAGVDNLVGQVPASVTLCNAAGVHDTATSELALALALASLRGLDTFARNHTAGSWSGFWTPGLADRRVTILGAGHIARAIEQRLAGFEVASITRVGRTARTEPVEVRAVDDLPEILAETDVLFIIIPLTDDTRGLVDARMLAALPDGALVVNVGRGPIVDTDALVAECASGRLRAALDVTDPEPLPDDHPLWGTPGVLVSPHVGGWSAAFTPRRDRLIAAQLRRWIAGEALDNVIER